MSKTTVDVHSDFAAVLGESQVVTEPEACAEFAVDGVTPKCVAYPSTEEQVAEALKFAAERDLAVIPSRSRTKLGIGAPPKRYDAALCLKDLNQVWYYEPDDLVVSVGPGMKFGDLQHFLARHKLWLPLDPQGGERASVGGILATNSAGPLRLHYGAPRDMVLGLKVATVEGKIIKTGGRVVKNVAGYDLSKLLVGSYGTIGVIVEATFKLYPQAVERSTWVIEPGTLAVARELRRSLLRSPLRPLRAVLMNAAATGLFNGEGDGNGVGPTPELWIETGGSSRVMGRYSEDLGKLASQAGAAIRKADEDEAGAWERIADFSRHFALECAFPIILRASLPIAACEEFLERAAKEAPAQKCELAGLVHFGAGMVELGLKPAEGTQSPLRSGDLVNRTSSPAFIAFIDRLRLSARDLGGSLTVQRCPLELKSQIDVWGPVGDDFEMMRKLKAAWDPKGILSPGRLLGSL